MDQESIVLDVDPPQRASCYQAGQPGRGGLGEADHRLRRPDAVVAGAHVGHAAQDGGQAAPGGGPPSIPGGGTGRALAAPKADCAAFCAVLEAVAVPVASGLVTFCRAPRTPNRRYACRRRVRHGHLAPGPMMLQVNVGGQGAAQFRGRPGGDAGVCAGAMGGRGGRK